MNVVLAFDAWKECLSAAQAGEAAARGIARLAGGHTVVQCPLSDGGEGFAETLACAAKGTVKRYRVTGPLGTPVDAGVAFLDGGHTAVVESAQAVGLNLIPAARRNPGRTTTKGVGEMILCAINDGASQVVIGLGGSSTNDAGVGMLSALGWEFLDSAGKPLPPCGECLPLVRTIRSGRDLGGVRIVAACDVRNPLHGRNGAARVFSLQKGASEAQAIELDRGLAHFAGVASRHLDNDLAGSPGAGAAGGLGYALLAFLHAGFRPGAEMAIALSGLRGHLRSADVCITGEGRTDYQTAQGKLPAAVAACSVEEGVPCLCLSGGLGERWTELYTAGFSGIYSVTPRPMPLEDAIRQAPEFIADSAESLMRTLQSVKREA